jgi:hypothetical protein
VDAILPGELALPPRAHLTCDRYGPAPGVPPEPSTWRRAVRDARFKLIDSPNANLPAGEAPRELFDLLLDPLESVNLLEGTLPPRYQATYDRLWSLLP